MMCPNCSQENVAGSAFCGGCGEDLSSVQPVVASQDPGVAVDPQNEAAAPAASGDVVTTLTWNSGDSLDPENRVLALRDNAEYQIHREGSAKAIAGLQALAIPHPVVSNTPIKVVLKDGRVTVEDTGSANGFYVARKVTKADGAVEIDLAKGEYILWGETQVFFA